MASLKELLGVEPHEVPAQDAPMPHSEVPPHRLTAHGLREHFAASLPWQPEVVRERRWGEVQGVKPAAVLMPLVQRDELMVLLTHRAPHLRAHAGQVAFPGGKIDEEDRGAIAAALREAQEEVGLEPAGADVVGELPPYFTGSGYSVTAVVAVVQPPVLWRPNPTEVESVFEVPLRFLMSAANHKTHRVQIDQKELTWWSISYHDGVRSHYIWGATAAMLRNFYRMLSVQGVN